MLASGGWGREPGTAGGGLAAGAHAPGIAGGEAVLPDSAGFAAGVADCGWVELEVKGFENILFGFLLNLAGSSAFPFGFDDGPASGLAVGAGGRIGADEGFGGAAGDSAGLPDFPTAAEPDGRR